jgi:hypothetical protein
MPLREIIHMGAFGCEPSRHLASLLGDEKAPAAGSPQGLGLIGRTKRRNEHCLQIVIPF